jgi:hypothetical protein
MSRKSKKSPENGSSDSNLVSIQDMADQAELNTLRIRLLQMEKDSVAMGDALNKALLALDKKDQEIRHLQELLTPFTQHVTDEEMIALRQLESLKIIAMSRDLTLEEIKKYDLLVKNKRLSQGSPTTIDADYEKLPSNTEDLKKLASRKIIPIKE